MLGWLKKSPLRKSSIKGLRNRTYSAMNGKKRLEQSLDSILDVEEDCEVSRDSPTVRRKTNEKLSVKVVTAFRKKFKVKEREVEDSKSSCKLNDSAVALTYCESKENITHEDETGNDQTTREKGKESSIDTTGAKNSSVSSEDSRASQYSRNGPSLAKEIAIPRRLKYRCRAVWKRMLSIRRRKLSSVRKRPETDIFLGSSRDSGWEGSSPSFPSSISLSSSMSSLITRENARDEFCASSPVVKFDRRRSSRSEVFHVRSATKGARNVASLAVGGWKSSEDIFRPSSRNFEARERRVSSWPNSRASEKSLLEFVDYSLRATRDVDGKRNKWLDGKLLDAFRDGDLQWPIPRCRSLSESLINCPAETDDSQKNVLSEASGEDQSSTQCLNFDSETRKKAKGSKRVSSFRILREKFVLKMSSRGRPLTLLKKGVSKSSENFLTGGKGDESDEDEPAEFSSLHDILRSSSSRSDAEEAEVPAKREILGSDNSRRKKTGKVTFSTVERVEVGEEVEYQDVSIDFENEEDETGDEGEESSKDVRWKRPEERWKSEGKGEILRNNARGVDRFGDKSLNYVITMYV